MMRIFSENRLSFPSRIDAIFYFFFLQRLENDADNYGLVQWNGHKLATRKLGFYAYQSFVVA